MANFTAFYDARNLFIEQTRYTEPLSYEEWKAKPEDLKAALLFVQFFDQITLAWDKANTLNFIESEEGVETMMQYLQKQISDCYIKGHPKKKVSFDYYRKYAKKCRLEEQLAAESDASIISEIESELADLNDIEECERRCMLEEDKSKFSPGYIYRVAYNCLYCICHDRKCDKDRLENETSGIIMHDGEEFDLFSTLADKSGSVESVYTTSRFESEFWRIIEDEGKSAEKLMRYLLSENSDDLKKLDPKKHKDRYKSDPLRDVEVNSNSIDSILSNLRERFMELPHDSECGKYISRMKAVFA